MPGFELTCSHSFGQNNPEFARTPGRAAVSSDGAVIAVVLDSDPWSVKFINGLTGQLRCRLSSKNFAYSAVTCAPHNHEVAVGTADGRVHFYSIDGAEQGVALDLGRDKLVNHLAYSSDGQFLAVGVYKTALFVFERPTLSCVAMLQSEESVASVQFVPQRTAIAISFYYEKTIQIWDWQTRKSKHFAADGPTCAIAPDGHSLALSGKDYRVEVYDLDSSQRISVLVTERGRPMSWVYIASRAIASAHLDGTLAIWSIDDPGTYESVQAHQDAIGQLIYAPGRATLFTASPDDGMKAWEIRIQPGKK